MSLGENRKLYVGHRQLHKTELVKLGEGKADREFNKEVKAILDGTSEQLHDFKKAADALLQDMIEEFKNETEDSRWEDGSKN